MKMVCVWILSAEITEQQKIQTELEMRRGSREKLKPEGTREIMSLFPTQAILNFSIFLDRDRFTGIKLSERQLIT